MIKKHVLNLSHYFSGGYVDGMDYQQIAQIKIIWVFRISWGFA